MLFSPISTYVVCMQNIAIILLCKSKNNSSNPIKKIFSKVENGVSFIICKVIKY